MWILYSISAKKTRSADAVAVLLLACARMPELSPEQEFVPRGAVAFFAALAAFFAFVWLGLYWLMASRS